MTEIREIRLQDIDAVANIYVESWQAGYRGLLPDVYLDALTPDRWAVPFRQGFGGPDQPGGLALWEDGQIIGVTHFSAARDDDLPPGAGEVISLYLLPGHWGRGLGTLLLQAALDALRERGYTRVVLWTLRDNLRAQRAYMRCGFAADGARKAMEIGGAQAEALRFSRPL